MPAQPLAAHEREEIRVGIERDESHTAIAVRPGRHRCTISAEVNRNGGRAGYSAARADQRALRERARAKIPLLAADLALSAHVTARRRAKDSPMTISIELAAGTHGIVGSVSHHCIYQSIHAHGTRGLPKGLHTGLHRGRRCRKHRLPKGSEPPVKIGPLGEFNLVAARPPVAADRSEVGHLEGELIVGAFNRSAIVTVFNRTSRHSHLWLADLPEGHGAEATLAALVEVIDRIPEQLRRTLTWDQGREMARHAELAELCGIDIYFAEPHSPWQRPTNENGNGLIRRYVGKGTDLNRYTPADLRAIEQRINTIPRRSLNWSTTAHNDDRLSGAFDVVGGPGRR